jgi:hypothetical protein
MPRGVAPSGTLAHPEYMARLFRFRLVRGTVTEVDYEQQRSTQHGPGFELELTEVEAAKLFRHRADRDFELIEVIDDDDDQKPGKKLPG